MAYRVLDKEEHIRQRTELYMGTMPGYERDVYVLTEANKQERVMTKLSPAAERCVTEILMNAQDNVAESRAAKIDPGSISVKLDTDGTVTITNGGRPMPVTLMTLRDGSELYVPEVMFSHGFSSSHYNDSEQRETAGLNGVGAKACNILSSFFSVYVCDGKKSFSQTWTNSALESTDAVVKPCKDKPCVRVSFRLDMRRFDSSTPLQESADLLRKMCSDAALYSLVPVTYECGGVTQTYDYRRGVSPAMTMRGAESYVHLTPAPGLKLYLLDIPNGTLVQESFVNGTPTRSHGNHVQAVVKAMIKQFKDHNEELYAQLTPTRLLESVSFVLCATVDRPEFDGQCKDKLTSKVPPVEMKGLVQLLSKSAPGIVERVKHYLEALSLAVLNKRVGGSKRPVLTTLRDANCAGMVTTEKRRLWLTEGLSASRYAKDAIMKLRGSFDYDGTLALRGVPLSVRKASAKSIAKNSEIEDIQLALGLEIGKEYSSTAELRYDQVIIAADADGDGYHIRNLIVDLFEVFAPSLLRKGVVSDDADPSKVLDDAFLVAMLSPLLRVTVGAKSVPFYTYDDYKEWQAKTNSKAKPHYCKGLGSTPPQQVAKDMEEDYTTIFRPLLYTPGSAEALALAFDGKSAKLRKEWLLGERSCEGVHANKLGIPIPNSIQLDMRPHSLHTLRRALPNYMCGLKDSEMQVLWAALKRSSKSNALVKVDALMGDVLDLGYKHGNASLYRVIVAMASGYAGTNNLPYLHPEGNYGSRDELGKDAAASRYLETRTRPYLDLIFRQEDSPLLSVTDGVPDFFLPVVDMLTINGARGIATGWSTFMPPHDPLQVIDWLCARLRGETYSSPILPWFRYFKGRCDVTRHTKETDARQDSAVEQDDTEEDEDEELDVTKLSLTTGKSSLLIKGAYTTRVTNGMRKVIITELPLYRSFSHYDTLYSNMQNSVKDCSFVNDTGTVNVAMELTTPADKLPAESIVKELELSVRVPLSNMVSLGPDGIPTKHDTAEEALERFYKWRLGYYDKRRDLLIRETEDKIKLLSDDLAYLRACLDGSMTFTLRNRAEFVAELQRLSLSPASARKYSTEDLNTEKLEETEQKLSEQEARLAELLESTPELLWLADLAELRDAIVDYYENNDVDVIEVRGEKKTKAPTKQGKKTAARRTTKK